MISEKRYLSVKELFKELGFDNLTEHEIELYGDMFEIIAQLTHNKLTDKEMITAYDILVDTADGRNFKFAIEVPKADRIKVQLRLMEELPETAGKLTLDEKVKFAFCVYHSYFIEVYDEERQGIFKGLIEFTSVQKILDLMEDTKKSNPALFDFDSMAGVSKAKNNTYLNSDEQKADIEKMNKEIKENMQAALDQLDKDFENLNNQVSDYGYSKANPILVPSIPSSYIYLNALKYPNAKELRYSRYGSMSGVNGGIIDKYIVTVTMTDDSVKEFELYINPYAAMFSKVAPAGFILSLPKPDNTTKLETSSAKRKNGISKLFSKLFKRK